MKEIPEYTISNTNINHNNRDVRPLVTAPTSTLYNQLYPNCGIPSQCDIDMNWGITLNIIPLIESMGFKPVWDRLDTCRDEIKHTFFKRRLFTRGDGYMIILDTDWTSETCDQPKSKKLLDLIKKSINEDTTGLYDIFDFTKGNEYPFCDGIELITPSPDKRDYKSLNLIVDTIKEIVKSEDAPDEPKEVPKVHMLVKEEYEGVYFKSYDMSKHIPDMKDSDLFYGEGFSQWNNLFIERVVEQKKGVALLHGAPGTGKTHYIRFLLSELSKKNKRVIYIPPSMVETMTDPTVLGFLTSDIASSEQDTILLIEDAEPLLASRGMENRTTGISNLLNSTDGILNDILGLVVIATFNTDLKNIDEALLRPGRLLARKEFGKLNKDNILEICKKFSIDLSKINTKKLDNYTIAELLSNKDNNLPLVHGLNNNKVSLGFSAGN